MRDTYLSSCLLPTRAPGIGRRRPSPLRSPQLVLSVIGRVRAVHDVSPMGHRARYPNRARNRAAAAGATVWRMTAIAEISVIASATVGTVVGLGAPVLAASFAAKREQRAAEHARVREDRIRDEARVDELRAVLDDASTTLAAAWEAMPTDADVQIGIEPEQLERARRALHAIWAQEARIAARVGTDGQLYLTYRVAHEVAGDMYRIFRQIHQAQLGRLHPPEQGALTAVFDRLPRAEGAFFDATAAAIGPYRD